MPPSRPRLPTLLAAVAATVLPTGAATAVPEAIPGLYNTGVDDSGAALPAGAADPHYRLVESADEDAAGPGTFVVEEGFPIPPWLANSAGSKWIAPEADQGTGNAPGDYIYRLTFDLNGFQPATANLTGRWSSDNAGLRVDLNGSPTGQSQNGAFGQFHALTIEGGFVAGTNTLDFVVNNAGDSANPTGLRVELSGTAEPELPPGTPPSISASPADTSVVLGASARLSVVATGALPLTYTWEKDGALVPGAGGATLTLSSATLEDAGSYTVTVTNPWGSAAGAPARLTVTFDLPSPEARAFEAPGPSSRRSGLAITEVHYHPAEREDGRETEFVEIFNSNPWPEPVGGFRLGGQWDYTFAAGTEIPAGGYLVVAAAPEDLAAVYGRPANLTGGLSQKLANGGGTIRLEKPSGAVLLEIDYDDGPPWPVAADGGGASLVLARPSLGENDTRAWSASTRAGGSPGAADPVPTGPLHQVRINEVLAHTPGAEGDFIELVNRSPGPVDLSGCRLDEPAGTAAFTVPGGTLLPPGGYLAFGQEALGFDLAPAGGTLRLVSPDGAEILDAVRTGGRAAGVPWLREGGAGTPTPGAPNDATPAGAAVITEIFYHPPSGDDRDEFIEIANPGDTLLDLSLWRFTDGIDFVFPERAQVGPSGAVVVAKDPGRLLANHPGLDPALVFGGYGGSLSDAGERVALARPLQDMEAGDGSRFFALVDEVTYIDGGAWGRWSDGGGSSLELTAIDGDNRLPQLWRDSPPPASATTWTSAEITGLLDHGKGSADQLQVFLLGAGEALLDDVEVVPPGGPNRLANPSFEAGTAGWTAQGTHRRSGLWAGGSALHLRAVGRGDITANRIRTPLTAAFTNGDTASIRGRFRWLRGHPEILLRLRGGHLELVARPAVPRNLGSPGSAGHAAGPAGTVIHGVRHEPILPAAGEPVLVTARVAGPPGGGNPRFNYRIDPSLSVESIPMNDEGTGGDLVGGDGVFSALLPGQPGRERVAFWITAGAGAGAGRFPQVREEDGEIPREGVIVWGDGDYGNRFGTYRIWMTAAVEEAWRGREKLSNEPLPVTFVYGRDRAVYGAGALYSGSAFTSPGYDGPAGRVCGYNVVFPQDGLLLGEDEITLDFPVRDSTAQREQLMYSFLDRFGLTNNYRRYVDVWVNGTGQRARRGWGTNSNAIYEDVQQPGADMVREWFPDAGGGHLFKGDLWHEFTDDGARIDPATACTFQPFISGSTGELKKARYRWSWRPRATGRTADDFGPIFDLVRAFETGGDDLVPALGSLVDLENWARSFVVNDLASNWDSFGNPGGKNSFHYKPPGGRWQVMNWDYDVGLGVFNDPVDRPLFEVSDPAVRQLYSEPAFLRRYWRNLRHALDTFFSPAGVADELDKKYAAFEADGVPLTSPDAPSGTGLSIPAWISARADFLRSQLEARDTPTFAITTNGGADFTAGDGPVVELEGTAPLDVFDLTVNGAPAAATWTGVTRWRLRVVLAPGANLLSVAGRDAGGNPLPGRLDAVTVTLAGGGDDPAAGNLVINEIYLGTGGQAGTGFVELHNRSADTAFDLSGWRFNGLGLTFPPGSLIGPGGYFLASESTHGTGAAFGWDLPAAAYPGRLDPGGEALTLFAPAAGGGGDEVVIDAVRYDDAPPWPAPAPGSSLQLADPAADNGRPANWGVVDATPVGDLVAMTSEWRYWQAGSLPGIGWQEPGFADAGWPSGPTLFFNEGAPLPAPKNTPLGLGRITYYFRTAFEYAGPVGEGATLALSTIVDDGFVLYLNGAEVHRLRIRPGAVGNSTLASPAVGDATLEGPAEIPTPSLVQGTNTLAVEVHQATFDSSDIVFGLRLAPAAAALAPLTPGAPNSVPAPARPTPPVWVNEVMAENTGGLADGAGEAEPWLELYHAGQTPLDLGGLFLTDDGADLTQWAFPAGATLAPGSFTVVFADGEPDESAPGEWHTSFRLPPAEGLAALTDGVRILSALPYQNLPAGVPAGLFPDGSNAPADRLVIATPAASNDAAIPLPPVRINEWLADNPGPFNDPADGDPEDWFELFNAGAAAVDLTGFTLTDNPGEPARFTIPAGATIAGGGYLLVWADGEPSQNVPGDPLHTNFRLSAGGESIGLFTPDGRPVDLVTFGPQVAGVSQGRGDDGAIGDLPSTTPGAANFEIAPPPPTLAGRLPDGRFGVTVTTEVGQVYQLEVSPDLTPGSWQAVDEPIAGDGGPATLAERPPPGALERFYRLVIRPSPQAP